MKKSTRIFDANINRACEGLRVLEDIARFECDIISIATELKNIRHNIRSSTSEYTGTFLDRDVPGDVGIEIEAEDEFYRPDIFSLISSNSSRVSEALRVIEEVARFLNYEDVARKSASWRYQTYKVQKSLLQIFQHKNRQWSLCLLLTKSQCAHSWETIARSAFEIGIDAIQVREPNMEAKELIETIELLLTFREDSPSAVIVNDRLDIALASGADGVHLGALDLPISEARRIAGKSFIIGATAHTLDEGIAAVESGASYVGLGSIFKSSTKPTLNPVGTKLLVDFINRCPQIPHLAIGGVCLENTSELLKAGVRGVAVSSAICSSGSPEKEIKRFMDCFANKKHPLNENDF